MSQSTTTLQISQIPDSPLSVGDLVGRGLRITRLRWREMLGVFLFPAFLFCLSFSVASWFAASSDHTWLVVELCMIALSLAILFFSRWEILVLGFAVNILLLEQASNFHQAIERARKQSWTILFLGLPSMLIDIMTLGVSTGSCWLTAGGHSSAEMLRTMIGLAMFGVLLASSVPLGCITVLNAGLIAAYASERLSWTHCSKRFMQFVFEDSAYVLKFILLCSLVMFVLSVPSNLVAGLHALAGTVKGVPKELVTAILSVIECCIMTPLYAFIYCATAASASCFYEQLRIRLECRDLLRRLSNLNEIG